MANQEETMEETHSSSVKPEDSTYGLAAVSLQSRILPFWREQPRLWFAQFEAVVSYQKISNDQKYRFVLGVLQQRDIEQVSDLIMSPPATGRYEALKNRLLSVYEESESKQLQKLLAGIELGDQKPSHLLRRMRDLAGSKVPDDALRVMWMGQLPTQIRAVLSISKDTLDELASMADKMMEHMGPCTIAAITPQPSSSSTTNDSKIDFLTSQIQELKLEIAEMRRGRGREQHRGQRSRSSSRRPRNPRPDWLCYYHHRFGDMARKCEEPCAKRKPAASGN